MNATDASLSHRCHVHVASLASALIDSEFDTINIAAQSEAASGKAALVLGTALQGEEKRAEQCAEQHPDRASAAPQAPPQRCKFCRVACRAKLELLAHRKLFDDTRRVVDCRRGRRQQRHHLEQGIYVAISAERQAVHFRLTQACTQIRESASARVAIRDLFRVFPGAAVRCLSGQRDIKRDKPRKYYLLTCSVHDQALPCTCSRRHGSTGEPGSCPRRRRQ